MNEQIAVLEKVASLLTGLNRLVVYTGGATIALYLDPVAADDVRPTRDVDCVVDVNSRLEYYALSAELRGLGLQESQEGPLCRWIYNDLIVDVMPTEPAILGFSNSWYSSGPDAKLECVSWFSYFLPAIKQSIFQFSRSYPPT